VGPFGNYATMTPFGGFPNAVGTANEEVSLQWLSTIRARAGLPVLSDRGLLFVTGGLAVGNVFSSGSVTVANAAGSVTWSGSNSSTLTGYSVGGGPEYALTNRWTTKAEYLWYDLGNTSHSLNCTATSPPGQCVPIDNYPTLGSTVSPVRGSIVRMGLNYKFN
jgi:outer membrane immunogenic protein